MNSKSPDSLKVNLTIGSALKSLDRLEQALDQGDQRKAGNELYNIRRELHLLKTMFQGEPHRLEKA